MLVSRTGVISKNSVLEGWRQEDSLELKKFSKNPRGVNDAGSTILYLVPIFLKCSFKLLNRVQSAPITTRITLTVMFS